MRRCAFAGAAMLALAMICNSFITGQGKKDVHDPANAIANLDIHPEVTATLFASEGKITNPTNLDIDHRGRVWICDVKNYRGNNGKRPEGDRILILEDKDGDGVADDVKTFYQGRDIDSAMGLCILGNKVIVSASPNIFVFTFDEHDKVTKKEVLFTKTGIAQHDHSAHSFLFGPDGKLYWNFGNTGGAVHDKAGKPVVDLAGNVVRDNGHPYRQGMAFRCALDGSNFEVLGHNFRNNYELTVDSFGTVWQSDNDDDGNRGVRINYVMEFGNYGYSDEMNGSGWQSKRTNIETEIPLRHWHLNDPGVVPNLLQTGGGSPTGICINEGSLLPKVFQNQVIHCDAGPSVCRAYPATVDGAGYKATSVDILNGQKRNNWFRPADACIAPDGSLFVTDWYDPGVGGHAQRDIDRGRIFRVAPAGAKYTRPTFDFASDAGLIDAMKNPNLAVRYIAWTKLHEKGEKAEPALLKLAASTVPHEQARALWLLGNIPGRGQKTVDMALASENPDLRIVGVRLARELKLDLIPIVTRLVSDPSAAVRREGLIALRHHKAPEAARLWANLAKKYDGQDRWYLEALGIGADKQWDAYLNAYLTLVGPSALDSKSGRDLVWRSRAADTPTLLALIIGSKATPASDLPRYFRAFDFQPDSEVKQKAVVGLAFMNDADPARSALISGESVARLGRFDINQHPEYKDVLRKSLDASKGTAKYIDLVGKFNLRERFPELLALARKAPNDQLGVDAMRALLERDQSKLVLAGITDAKDREGALAILTAVGNASHPGANGMLTALVVNGKADLELRRQATRALARTKPGAAAILKLAQGKQLAKELEAAAGSALHQSTAKEIRSAAQKLFPLPAAKDNAPIPVIAELVKLKGNVAAGKEVFAKVGTCANCHVINGEGKEVGPNLSEIGKKLAKEALFESILYPSASISHNFETWVVETRKGDVLNGLLVSQTPDEVVVKGADALLRSLKKADVENLAKSPISLMPADLTKNLTSQDLANVVEYMLTLRDAKK